ncbi:MAG: rRNA maturation RNase YbeY [Bacteroidales bacterium]|jgi:rRNA maturation RNase YbeY|nr:rRNA maturation RNase YbeY [Bacteroidales bacterium]
MPTNITFTNIDIKFTLLHKKELRSWLNLCARHEGKFLEEIAYNFCSDDFLLKMNKQYLNKDYYTDVITFDYCEELRKHKLRGDIFISIERVKENAMEYGVSMQVELLRVMAHGILHLCGYTDKSKKTVAQMSRAENRCLRRFYRKPL